MLCRFYHKKERKGGSREEEEGREGGREEGRKEGGPSLSLSRKVSVYIFGQILANILFSSFRLGDCDPNLNTNSTVTLKLSKVSSD